MNSESNDLAENWSYSTIVYDEAGSQIGTPGLANDGSLPPGPADFGTGEVIITEYHNRPLKPTDEQLAAHCLTTLPELMKPQMKVIPSGLRSTIQPMKLL